MLQRRAYLDGERTTWCRGLPILFGLCLLTIQPTLWRIDNLLIYFQYIVSSIYHCIPLPRKMEAFVLLIDIYSILCHILSYSWMTYHLHTPFFQSVIQFVSVMLFVRFLSCVYIQKDDFRFVYRFHEKEKFVYIVILLLMDLYSCRFATDLDMKVLTTVYGTSFFCFMIKPYTTVYMHDVFHVLVTVAVCWKLTIPL